MPHNKQRILLVEDEIETAEIIGDYLENTGYLVELMHTGARVVERVSKTSPDLVLLDIMLPEVDGITICKQIRASSDVPIILLTAKVDEVDRLLGYDLGADDYICKPVNPREILARVKAVLRRTTPSSDSDQEILTLDKSRQLAVYRGQRLKLTRMEFSLLRLLFDNEGKVFNRQQIKDKIYSDPGSTSDRAVDTCIKKLRHKMNLVTPEESPIHSIYGVGYKFERDDNSIPG